MAVWPEKRMIRGLFGTNIPFCHRLIRYREDEKGARNDSGADPLTDGPSIRKFVAGRPKPAGYTYSAATRLACIRDQTYVSRRR